MTVERKRSVPSDTSSISQALAGLLQHPSPEDSCPEAIPISQQIPGPICHRYEIVALAAFVSLNLAGNSLCSENNHGTEHPSSLWRCSDMTSDEMKNKHSENDGEI